MSSNILIKLLLATVNRKWIAIALLVVISIIAGLGHYDPDILKVRPLEEMQEKNGDKDSEKAELPDVSPLRLDQSDAILVVQCDDFFTPEAVTAMRHVVEKLESLDQVSQILWMDKMPPLNIFGLPQPLLPRSKAPPAVFETAKEKAMSHPLVGGQLLDATGTTTMLLVFYDWRYNLTPEDTTTELKETARLSAAECPDVDLEFMITGKLPGQVAAVAHHRSNSTKFQVLGYGLSLILGIILFRGIRAMIVVALAPGMAIFWSIGIIRYLDYQGNGLVVVIVPVLVSLVALTDAVHLLVQIRRHRGEGLGKNEAIREGLRRVGMACFLTSLTTAIGFGSLILADSETVKEFGIASVYGVIFAFLSVALVVPLACSTWLGNKIHTGHESGFVDRNLMKIKPLINFVMSRSVVFSALGILGTLLFVGISLRLEPDFRISNNLPKKSEELLAMRHLDRVLKGVEFAEVRVKWNDSIDPESAEIYQVVSKIDALIKKEELIGETLSIYDLIGSLPGSGPAEERMTLLELLPPSLKRSFYTPERQTASVQFRVRDLGIAKYGPVFERLENGLEEIGKDHPEFQLRLRGNAIWRWENIYEIVADLFKSLGVAIVIIFLVLTLVYRSLRIGLISMVPNLFPLSVAGAALALTGFNLEIVMVCAFTVCLGIAVDDTIHFLTRYRQERENTNDEATAIRRAFTGVGSALIMTTIVVIAGFGGVLFSDSRDHQIFAMMGVITIAMALFADLVFLPALLKQFSKKN